MAIVRLTAVGVALSLQMAHASPPPLSTTTSPGTPVAPKLPVFTRAARTPPSGWKPAPQIATAAASAMATEWVTVAASDAWSEPATGCYALSLRLVAPVVSADEAAHQLVASIKEAGFAVRDIIVPTSGPRGVVSLSFIKAPYRGLVRAVMAGTDELAQLRSVGPRSPAGIAKGGAGVIDAVACAWNQREPSICATACATFVEPAR